MLNVISLYSVLYYYFLHIHFNLPIVNFYTKYVYYLCAVLHQTITNKLEGEQNCGCYL
jgi:hypothetical protein